MKFISNVPYDALIWG